MYYDKYILGINVWLHLWALRQVSSFVMLAIDLWSQSQIATGQFFSYLKTKIDEACVAYLYQNPFITCPYFLRFADVSCLGLNSFNIKCILYWHNSSMREFEMLSNFYMVKIQTQGFGTTNKQMKSKHIEAILKIWISLIFITKSTVSHIKFL